MRDRVCAVVLASGCLLARGAFAEETIEARVNRELPALVETYKTLHAAPELSHHEEKTAAFVAGELRALGYSVTEGIGKYARPEWKAYGLIGVLENGAGPTVLVRTDLDALPVEEKTGLPYASAVKTKDDAGQDVRVMHACGHDLHMTSFLGTAKVLAAVKAQWRGTLVMLGQPAEETIDGARAMLDDGLYGRIRTPDFVIALHDSADVPAGKVAYTSGFSLASANTVVMTVRGVGGHGSRPEATKDPIVLTAQIVLALQTIVSRENSPLDPAVVSVGSIHGGTKNNIIPDEVRLGLTVRTYKDEVRTRILASIERIAKNTALAAGVPADRLPIVDISATEAVPAMYNNPELAERLAKVFRTTLGADNVVPVAPVMGSEDFGRFALEGNRIPSFMFWLGASDPAVLEDHKGRGVPPPGLHSSLFAPLPEPAIRTGVRAMTAAVLNLLAKSK